MVSFFWNFQIVQPHSHAPLLQNVNMAMTAWSHVSTINSREAVRVCVWAYLRLKTVQRKQNFGAIYCMYIASQWGVNTVPMLCSTYSCNIVHIIHCFFCSGPLPITHAYICIMFMIPGSPFTVVVRGKLRMRPASSITNKRSTKNLARKNNF